MALPKTWIPERVQDLIRVGPNLDGGYVLSQTSMMDTQVLIGLGLRDDWQFEEDFQKRSGAKVICYDHTVTQNFWRHEFKQHFKSGLKGDFKRFRECLKFLAYRRFFDQQQAWHHQVKIGFPVAGSTTIREILLPLRDQRVFLKMDIEGWEYRVMTDIPEFQESLTGLAIEFHSVDLHRDRISAFIEALQPYFRLVHIHPNNAGGCDHHQDPLVIEISWVHRRYDVPLQPTPLSDYPLAGLDFINRSKFPDLRLAFES